MTTLYPPEAQRHIDNGGIVTSGGYTIGKGIYFADGTYPGCIRGGDIEELISYSNNSDRKWIPVSEKDIVCRKGYRKMSVHSTSIE